jgi:hypothetical protein
MGRERYLNEAEAAAMLQPFMGSKNALAWLNADRRTDPVIPYSRRNGDVLYREADLVTFVRYGMKSPPISRGLQRRFVAARRKTADRRSGVERREVAERRHPAAERRGSGH